MGWLAFAPRDHSRAAVLANATVGLSGAPVSIEKTSRGGGLTALNRLAPPRVVAKLNRLQALAGRPRAWTMRRILLAKLVLPIFAAAIGLLYVTADPTRTRILMVAAFVAICHFVPDLLLRSTGQKRQAQIALELPDTLDQMTIAVEAGLGFEAAMMRSAKNGKGPFAEELIRTLQEMQFGQTRREAYLALAARTTVVDLRRFLRAVIQADVYLHQREDHFDRDLHGLFLGPLAAFEPHLLRLGPQHFGRVGVLGHFV